MPKIKNILIFLVIGAVFVSIYFFVIRKPSPDTSALISSTETPAATNTAIGDTGGNVTQDFLALLLNVKNIKLNDAIFSDIAFTSLDGSHSITLTPDGTEGRVNPFAPFGTDVVTSPAVPPATNTPPQNNTPVTTKP